MSSSAHFPVWPTASQPSRIPAESTRWADVDFEKAALQWETVRDKLLEIFGK